MTNPYEGEVGLVIDGTARRMRLTLGALASLESSMQAGGLVPLVRRFETGDFGTRDVVAILLAGLRGGGWEGDMEILLDAEIKGGPMEATRAAAELLGRAFVLPREPS